MMPPRRPRRQPITAGGGGEATRPASDAAVGQGEFRSSDDRRTGYLAGISAFGVKRVEYSVVSGLAIFEGDIVLGTAEKVQKAKTTADSTGVLRDVPASGGSRPTGSFQHGVAIVGERYRWPDGVIPYEVQPEIEETVGLAIQ